MLHMQTLGPERASLHRTNGSTGLKAARLERGRDRPVACRGHITFTSGNHVSMSAFGIF